MKKILPNLHKTFRSKAARQYKRYLSLLLICAILLTLTPDSFPVRQKVSAATQSSQSNPKKDYQSQDCKITYSTLSAWGNSAIAEITITNTSTQSFDLDRIDLRSQADITSIWNAQLASIQPDSETGHGSLYTIYPEAYNTTIPAAGSIKIGINTEAADGTPQAPESICLRGSHYDNIQDTADREQETSFGNRCLITTKITNAWDGGIGAEIKIQNIGKEKLTDWSLTFPWDAKITQIWSAKHQEKSNLHIITPAGESAAIAPGEQITITLQASGRNSRLAQFVQESFFITDRANTIFTDQGGIRYLPVGQPSLPTSVPDQEADTPEPSEFQNPDSADSPLPEKSAEAASSVGPWPTASILPTKTPVSTQAPDSTASAPDSTTLAPDATASAPASTEPQGPLLPTVTPEQETSPSLDSSSTPGAEPQGPILPAGSHEPEATASAEPQGPILPAGSHEPEATASAEPQGTPLPASTPETTTEPLQDFYIDNNLTLEDSLECGNLYLRNGTLETNGQTIIVHGSLIQTGGTCLISKTSSLTVKHSCILSAGTLSVRQEGCLNINGSLTVSGFGRLEQYSQGSTPDTGNISIQGNLKLSGKAKANLQAGKIELGGDLSLPAGEGTTAWQEQNRHILAFTGTNKQTLQPEATEYTSFGTLDFTQAKAVRVPEQLHVYSIKGLNRVQLTGEKLTLHAGSMSLTQDETVHGDLHLAAGNYSIGGHNLHIEGNLTADGAGRIQIDNGSLQADGDIICRLKNELKINSSQENTVNLAAGGNLTITSGKLNLYNRADARISGNLTLAGNSTAVMDCYQFAQPQLSVEGNIDIRTTGQSVIQRGIITLGGNLIQDREAAKEDARPLTLSANATFQFNGTDTQAIQFANPQTINLGRLDFTQAKAVRVPEQLHVYSIKGLSRARLTGEKLTLHTGSMSLMQDEAIHGDLRLASGSCNLGDYNLHVKGNLTAFGAETIQIRNGCLHADRDITCELKNELKINSSQENTANLTAGGNLTLTSGKLNLYNRADARVVGNLILAGNSTAVMDCYQFAQPKLTVEGNIAIHTTGQSAIQRGTITLGGNLIQDGDTAQGEARSLIMSAGTAFLFTGQIPQEIQLASPETIQFGILDFSSASSVLVPEQLHGYSIRGLARVETVGKELTLYMKNVSLEQDETVHGNLRLAAGNYSIGSHNLHIKGNLTADGAGKIQIGNGSLQVDGDIICRLGDKLEITADKADKFSLTAGGSFTMQSGKLSLNNHADVRIQGNFRLAGDSSLSMEYWQYAPPELAIGKDLLIQTSSLSAPSCGTITIGGNLIQAEQASEDSFQPAGPVQVVLNGKEKQTIDMAYTEEIPHLNISQSVGVYMEQDFTGQELCGIEKLTGQASILTLYAKNIVSGDGTLNASLTCDGQIDLQGHHLKINGNYHQYGNTGGGGKLTVKGNYIAHQGTALLREDQFHVKGSMKVGADAHLEMMGQDAHLCVEEDLTISSRTASIFGLTGGTLEVKGNFRETDNAHCNSTCFLGTKLLLSGQGKQEIDIGKEWGLAYLYDLQITNPGGVTFTQDTIQAKQISGLEGISNQYLTISDSILTLQENEHYHGNLCYIGGYLDFNGKKLIVDGNLTQNNTVFRLNGGTLQAGGDYDIYGDSILQMEDSADLVRVETDMCTASTQPHSTLLTAGRLELYGDFQQTGNAYSFASSGSFTAAFLGEGPHLVDIESAPHSGFANIDPAYGSYTLAGSPLEIYGRGVYSICIGVVEGLIELSGLEEMSEAALLVCGGIGIVITVGAVAAPYIVLPVMAVGGLAASLGVAWEAMQEISDTVGGNSFTYEKAKEYGRNYAKLLVSVCAITESAEFLKDTALLRSLAAKLLDNPVVNFLTDLPFLRRAAIRNADDALKLLEGKVTDDALEALSVAMKEYDKKQLRGVVEAVDKVYDNTQEALTKDCVPKLLKEIGECEDSLDDAVGRVVRWIKKYASLLDELAKSNVKYNPDDVIAVYKNSEGKLMWLETGNSKAGFRHILERHEADFAGKGINDIPDLLEKVLSTEPVNIARDDRGFNAVYMVDGNEYKVAYGTNGFIVSFYPYE